MVLTPLLELVFALFLLIMPEGTKTFTITAPQISSSPIVWTLQKDGAWSGLSEDGQTSLGNWKTDGWKVIKLGRGSSPQEVVDLSEWVEKDDVGFLLRGNRLNVGKTVHDTFFFSTEGEPFSKMVKITPGKKP